MNRQPLTRDYHNRPRQAGGRTQADYGRTVLEPSGHSLDGVLAAGLTLAAVLALLWLGGFAGGVV